MPFMQRSIQWQLIVSMGAALLTSMLIVILVYSSAVNRLAERYLVGQALPANVAAIRNDIERTLAAPITATAGIAGNSLVQDWLLNGESADLADAMGRYLNGVKAQQNALATSIAVLDSGNYYSDAGLSRTLSRQAAGDGWFYSLVDSGIERRFEIDIDKASRLPTLFINQRIEAGGKTLGVAGLGYSLKSMSELISNFHFGERGEVYLINAAGRVKVHPRTENNDHTELSALIGTEAAQRLLNGSHDAVRFERDGETFRAIAQPVESLGGGAGTRAGQADSPGHPRPCGDRWGRR